jgi:hypothetical protein
MKGLSREARMLIDAAREGDDPSAGDRKRVRAGLARKLAVGAAAGVVGATATHAAAGGVSAAGSSVAAVSGVGAAGGVAAGAVAGGTIASGIGAKILVSVAIVGAMSAGTVSYVRHEAAKQAKTEAVTAEHTAAPRVGASRIDPSSSRSPAPVVPPVAVPIGASVAPSAPASVPLTDSAPRAAAVSKSLSNAPAAPAAPVAVAATRSDLDVELALLQEAQGALRMNDGARALRLLDEHARRFPNGALAEESEAARVFALREVGRTEEARDVAARFLREHPRSPLAPRVARAFETEASTF